jgi:cell division septation protein DedD
MAGFQSSEEFGVHTMRHLYALAAGFVFAVAGLAQTPPFGGGTPAASPASVVPKPQPASTPTTQRIQPVASTIDPDNQQQHPWAVKLDHGPWMICVRAYSGPNSRELAEKLVQEIRTTYKTAAYVFERNGAERRAELAQIEAIRQKERAKAEPFLRQLEQERKKAEATGSVFIDDRKPTIKVPVPYHQTPEQWAVLIGGFNSQEDARRALDVVKGFKDPADKSLMDRALVGAQTGKQGEEWKSEWNYINPYRGAIVVPNPHVTNANREEKGKLDPEVVEMNREAPFSLLKAKKPWTLIVRSYTVPIRFVGKDDKVEKDGNLIDRVMNTGVKKKDLYTVTAEEAVGLATALSHPKMENGPFKSFVLHHRTGTIVTVGEFDAPDDPELLRTQNILKALTFDMLDKNQKPVIGKDGRPEKQRMFDSVSPFPVPKY